MSARSVCSGTRPSRYHSVRAISPPFKRPGTITFTPRAPRRMALCTARFMARGIQGDADVLGRTLDNNLAECGVSQLLLQVLAQLDIRRQVVGVMLAARVPLCGPVADNAEAKTVRVDLLSHLLAPLLHRLFAHRDGGMAGVACGVGDAR